MLIENRPTEEYLFTWKIENCSLLFHMKINEELQSPLFNAETLSDTKWFVRLYPNGGNKESEGFASCFMHRSDEYPSADEITIDFSIEMINANGEVLISFKKENKIFKKVSSLGQYKFIRVDQLRTNIGADDVLTIRCRMRKNQNKKKKATGCEAVTKIGVNQSSFKWNVTILDSLEWSQDFTLSSQDILKFEISLLAPEEYVQIKICKQSDQNASLFSRFATFKITFLNERGMVVDSKTDTHLFAPSDDNTTWDFPTFITKKQVEIKMGPTSWYVFTLMCEISMSNGNFLSAIENTTFDLPSVSIPRIRRIITLLLLREDLRKILSDKKHCDVKLRAETETISAHKSLLVARSPVFSSMFEQDMLENQTGVVDILDMDGVTINNFLEFIYTGEIRKLNYEIAVKLFIAADKYQVESLKEFCSTFLITILNLKNVCDIIAIADLIGYGSLKSVAFNYIKSNASCILASSEWVEWSEKNFKLASEIFSKLSIDFGSTSSKV